MFCWKCGKENSDEMNYCKHCGAKLDLGKQTVRKMELYLRKNQASQ